MKLDSNISAPSLVQYYGNKYQGETDALLSVDHKHTDHKICPICNGSGKDFEFILEPCAGCDGTGYSHFIEWGIENGETYLIMKQNGLEFFKEYCKMRRETEMTRSERMKMWGIQAFAVPSLIEIEYMQDHDGITMRDTIKIEQEGVKKISRWLRRKYGETFMTTSLIV